MRAFAALTEKRGEMLHEGEKTKDSDHILDSCRGAAAVFHDISAGKNHLLQLHRMV